MSSFFTSSKLTHYPQSYFFLKRLTKAELARPLNQKKSKAVADPSISCSFTFCQGKRHSNPTRDLKHGGYGCRGFTTAVCLSLALPPLCSPEFKEIGAKRLFFAHHLDDQAETFIMRLAGQSGMFSIGPSSFSALFSHIRLGGVGLYGRVN